MIPFQTFKPDIRCSRPSAMGRKLAALSLAVGVLALAACSTHSARTPTPSLSIPAGPTSSTQPAPSSPSSSTPPTRSASFELGYQPLYPFASLADAQAWQAANGSGGHQPWHADAGATAIAFSRGWLGFNEIDTVTSTRTGADGAHIGVGYRDPNGRLRTAAVLHLVRFGNDPDSPWEVVGSDDDLVNFSLDTPHYGSPVTSPITVGGHIVGVDENIKVTVHRLASQAPVGTHCCTPAGPATPSGVDWSHRVLHRRPSRCAHHRRPDRRSPAGGRALRHPGRPHLSPRPSATPTARTIRINITIYGCSARGGVHRYCASHSWTWWMRWATTVRCPSWSRRSA